MDSSYTMDHAETIMDALILAAGKGTRMPSPRPKVLQTLLGETMLALVTATLHSLPVIRNIFTLTGYASEEVEREADRTARRLGRVAHCIEQKEQLGTGHAIMTALPFMAEHGDLLVVNGDSPLLTSDILQYFLNKARGADVAFLSMDLEDAGAYGRVIREQQKVKAIIEAKDFDTALYGPKEDAHEINTGIYMFSLTAIRRLLPLLSNNNKSGEYYITDLVSLGIAQKMDVRGIKAEHGDATSLLGVNNPVELASAESNLQKRRVQELLSHGVIMHSPESIRISPFSQVESGSELFGPCEIYGSSYIQSGARIFSHCVLRDTSIAGNTEIREFCHIEQAEIRSGALIGPFARLRPQALVDEYAHVGNFVELKKTHLGKGSKANHLTYLGDAEIGDNVNLGAGTITCNYDGTHKYRTVIGSNCFIGSNTALVAPITLEDSVLVGAGSVIVEDVPANMLTLGRGRQVIKPKKK